MSFHEFREIGKSSPKAFSAITCVMLASLWALPLALLGQSAASPRSPVLSEALLPAADDRLARDFSFSSPLLEHRDDSVDGQQDLSLRPEFTKSPQRLDIVPEPNETLEKIKARAGELKATEAQFQVPLGQGRILTLKSDITDGASEPLIAIGNPGFIDVAVISAHQLRIMGLRVGVTDLSITSAKGDTFHYEVQVLADLTLLERKLRSTFPDASISLSQLQNHVVVEGEARSQMQVANIIGMVSSYLDTITAAQRLNIVSPNVGRAASKTGDDLARPDLVGPQQRRPNDDQGSANNLDQNQPGMASEGESETIASDRRNIRVTGTIPNPSILNLLRVPTSQQVLLKVRVAELNRTAIRNIGANFLAVDQTTGAIFGTQIAGPVSAKGLALGSGLKGESTLPIQNLSNRGGTTVYGIFQNANFEMPLIALRRNGLLKILAEPNLVALSGQQSSFLVGGEYPVPVPQVSASGVAPTVTVRFKEFGVRLGFVPQVLDQETLRLTVAPEVSGIDFTIAVTLVQGGSPVPGLNVRRSYTTVEMKHGQTLAIAGLLYLKLDGTTDRVPGLGDLPVLGPFFSNTSNERIEKELVILVTPYVVEPMEEEQIPPQPGSEVGEPTDWEFYFLNRIESREGVDFRSTTALITPRNIFM
ncbi:MAG: type II and III secretion system protein family protein [bacterium]